MGTTTEHSVGGVPAFPPLRHSDHTLIRPIAAGAYSEVWLARNAVGTLRAVKIVRRDRHAAAETFEREFKGLQKFEPVSRSHEGFVDILTLGLLPEDAGFYYVMELADSVGKGGDGVLGLGSGEIPTPVAKPKNQEPRPQIPDPRGYQPRTLRAELKSRGAWPADEVIALGLKLTAALAHLHAQGLVHRDVKPSNIIFVGGEPKLADAGLAAAMDDAHSLVGTAGYIAPEGPGTPQGDLFALGKVLYEAAFGKDRQEFPALPADVASRPDHPRLLELNEIFLRACATDLRQRYQNAGEMRADLELLQRGKSVKRQRALRERWRTVRSGAVWLAAGAVALALIVLASRMWQPPAGPKAEKRSTNNVANDFYDLGRFYFDKATGKDYETATNYFGRAIKADPNFAQAHAALALTCVWLHDGDDKKVKLLTAAKDEAQRALALDDSLSDAHIALGWHKIIREWAWQEARQEFESAIRHNPSSGSCHHFYAEWLRMTGHTNEALKAMTQARNFAPRSMMINLRLADHFVAARRFEEAIKQADQAIAMDPRTLRSWYEFRISALCALGRYDEAIETERKARLLGGEPKDRVDAELQALKKSYESEGPQGYWRMRSWYPGGKTAYRRAQAYAQMGEKQKAIESLQTALEEREFELTFYVMTDWTLDPLRSELRFHEILKQMRLE